MAPLNLRWKLIPLPDFSLFDVLQPPVGHTTPDLWARLLPSAGMRLRRLDVTFRSLLERHRRWPLAHMQDTLSQQLPYFILGLTQFKGLQFFEVVLSATMCMSQAYSTRWKIVQATYNLCFQSLFPIRSERK